MAQQAKKVTRLRQIDADRVDGVDGPANGFPILMLKAVDNDGDEASETPNSVGCGCCPECGNLATKAVNAQGGIDEKPDIAGAKGIIVDLFKLIQAEAAEGATGAFGELYDIQMLCDAICSIQCFLWNEQAGDQDDGEPIYKSQDDRAESLAGYVLKKKHSAQNRRELAEKGHALPDGSYPIEDEEDLHNAAILARSGHGDVAAAKRLIAKRAKELGVANPLAAQKSSTEPETPVEETPEGQDVEKTTDAPEGAPEPELDPAVASAIAKAVQPLEAANQELREQLAVLKATPIPGQVALTAPASARTETDLAKAAYYERQAALTSNDRELSKYYADKAAELRG